MPPYLLLRGLATGHVLRSALARRGGLVVAMSIAACAQSPASEFEQMRDDVLTEDATVADETSSEAPGATTSDREDSGSERAPSTPDRGVGPEAPSSAATRDAASAAAGASARSDAGTSMEPSTGSTPPSSGTSATPSTTSKADAATTPAVPKPTDAGTSPPSSTVDASAPMAGPTCAAAPSYSTANACSQCICSKCSTQVAGCYASRDAAKNRQCAQIQECAETNHCTSSNCYCGDSALCLGAPAGKCASVITTIAGSDDNLAILRASNDAESPIGRANQIGLCSRDSCARECGL